MQGGGGGGRKKGKVSKVLTKMGSIRNPKDTIKKERKKKKHKKDLPRPGRRGNKRSLFARTVGKGLPRCTEKRGSGPAQQGGSSKAVEKGGRKGAD